MNIARDYSNNVNLKLAGWRVIHIWECEIKTKTKRNIALEALYLDIISKATKYSQQDTNTNSRDNQTILWECKLNCVKLGFVGSALAAMAAYADCEFINTLKELQIKVFFRPVS